MSAHSQRRRTKQSRKETQMKSWDVTAIDVRPHMPEILSSTDEARAIVLNLGAGDSLQDHEVHERAWLVVIEGEVEVTTATGARVVGGPALLVEFAPRERHQVDARSNARLLLLLTPWPGAGHPGAMTIEQKAAARGLAAERRRSDDDPLRDAPPTPQLYTRDPRAASTQSRPSRPGRLSG
jgi:quercetin dioxygenase-like cupin family protein